MADGDKRPMDRECIRDLIARYNVAGDSRALDDMCATFSADALYESAVFVCRGRSEIYDYLAKSWMGETTGARPRFHRHHISTTQIDLNRNGSASGIVYYTMITDIGLDHCGYYRDNYCLTDDGWRLSRRGVWMEWVNQSSIFVPEQSKRILRETGICGPAW